MRARVLVDGVPSSQHPLYATWTGLIARCTNPNNQCFADYGARGIEVCDRWLESFAAFVEDVGARPSSAHSLDREDNDGPYAPGNVRWVTGDVQANNRRPWRGERVLLRKTCEGQMALRTWIVDSKRSLRKIAADIRVSAPVLFAWVSGRARPEHHFRLAIERLTGVPATDWMTPEEWTIAFGSELRRDTG
jgi:hypothetical protein